MNKIRAGFNRASFDEDDRVLDIRKYEGMTSFDINPLFMEVGVVLDIKARKAKTMENGRCKGEIRELKSTLELIKGRLGTFL